MQTDYAIVDRKEFTEAFQPPRMKGLIRATKAEIPSTTIIRGIANILVVEGAFLERTFNIEGKWRTEIELPTKNVYDLLKKKLPKSETIEVFINAGGEFVIKVENLKVMIKPLGN
jgi:hypothetical protein